jgi:hypothetical protein
MVGRVLALQAAVMIGTTPVGGPVLGLLADHVGGRAPVVLGGLAAIAAAAVGTTLGRSRLAAGGSAASTESGEVATS